MNGKRAKQARQIAASQIAARGNVYDDCAYEAPSTLQRPSGNSVQAPTRLGYSIRLFEKRAKREMVAYYTEKKQGVV